VLTVCAGGRERDVDAAAGRAEDGELHRRAARAEDGEGGAHVDDEFREHDLLVVEPRRVRGAVEQHVHARRRGRGRGELPRRGSETPGALRADRRLADEAQDRNRRVAAPPFPEDEAGVLAHLVAVG
jgi:hypothetical protein